MNIVMLLKYGDNLNVIITNKNKKDQNFDFKMAHGLLY